MLIDPYGAKVDVDAHLMHALRDELICLDIIPSYMKINTPNCRSAFRLPTTCTTSPALCIKFHSGAAAHETLTPHFLAYS